VRALVAAQAGHSAWGRHVQGLLDGAMQAPKRGAKHDQAHPPIHPLRSVEPGELGGTRSEGWRVYELIARHFLACVSPDAEGAQTVVTVDVGGEAFTASGTQVASRGFLDVYPYQRWDTALLPADFVAGQRFAPTALTLQAGSTQPPHLLSEAELISLMDAHGIGTDATIPEHIGKVVDREYMTRESGDAAAGRFVPTTLGIGLLQVRGGTGGAEEGKWWAAVAARRQQQDV
jgi:DNA topoisomerase III